MNRVNIFFIKAILSFKNKLSFKQNLLFSQAGAWERERFRDTFTDKIQGNDIFTEMTYLRMTQEPQNYK